MVETKAETDKGLILVIEKIVEQGLDQIITNRDRLRCYRCSEYDHFARECLNALTDESLDELEDATLQMLTQDETSPLEIGFDEDSNM